MTHATAKPLTISAAKAAASELGFTLRKTSPGEAELVIYRKGSGVDAAHAYFTDCPVDALATARAMAADCDANRVTLTGRPATAAAYATIAAEDNREAAARYAADYSGAPACSADLARAFMAEAQAALATASDCPGAYDATAAHYDAARAVALLTQARSDTAGRVRRQRIQDSLDISKALADFHAEAMALAYAAEAKPRPVAHALAALAELESEDAAAPRKPRSLSAAVNPDAPVRQPRRKLARNRAELRRELADAIATHGPDSVAAELAALSLRATGEPGQSGGWPLYAFRTGAAIDADGLDSMAYGLATGGLV